MFRLRRRETAGRGLRKPHQNTDTHLIGHEPGSFSIHGTQCRVVASFQTDVGCVREVNEDRSRYVQPDPSDPRKGKGALFLIADGMGGHSAGEIASEMAANTVISCYYESELDPQLALKSAFREANRLIHEESRANEGLKGMGTTCTALVLRDGSAVSAHVGDSRIYLVRDNAIYVLTEDHSEVMEMVKRGLLTLDEARRHPDKNVILQALGSRPEVDVAIWDEPFPVRCGDKFIMCSDGLSDLVDDEQIRNEAAGRDPHTASEQLIALAKECGGYDNITVGVITVEPADERRVKETRETEVAR